MNEKERREYNEAFGRRVRDYRKNLNMTQAELALNTRELYILRPIPTKSDKVRKYGIP